MTDNHEIDIDHAARIFRSVFGTATSEARQNVVDAVDRYANELERERAEVPESVKTESFESLNELARAFRSGEKHARPQHTPILEGIRAVLAHLHYAGRLLAADETPFTAEQVEDVRTVANCALQYGNIASREAASRLDSSLPATEPAEEFSCTWGTVGCTCDGPLGDVAQKAANAAPELSGNSGQFGGGDCFEVCEGHPAPAEPAEEETKAEEWQERVADLESQLEKEIGNRDEMEERLTSLIYSLATVEEVGEWSNMNDLDKTFIDHMHSKIRQLERKAASSPVAPAPTETEWQTWQEVPEGVKYSPKARPPAGSPLRLLAQPLWVNRGGTRYQARSGTVSKIGDVEMFHFAPFVAAEDQS